MPRASSHAGHQVVGIVAAFLFQQLLPDLLRDDALQTGHHIRIGMRTDSGAYNIKGVAGMTAPVAYGLVGGILQGPVACTDGAHLGSQHLHPLYVHMLALHVEGSLIDHAGHVHQGADRGCGHPMLACSRLGDDALLAHLLGQQYLSDGVVDLVGTRVVQVLTLQVEAAAILLAHAAGKVQGRRTPYIVAKQRHVLTLKLLRLQDGQVLLLQPADCGIENLGHVGSAKLSIKSFLVN